MKRVFGGRISLQNLKTIRVKHAVSAIALFLVLATSASPVSSAGNDDCRNVTGKGVWTLIPSDDPLGRVAGPTTGNLKGVVTANLTNLAPNPDGSLQATSNEVWVLGPQDTLQFDGAATFTPVPGAPIGTVTDSLTLTAVSGTGKYAGATGTINVTGTGYNLFGPNAGPGNTFFEVRYQGTICTVN
jgi:hypothetical protein